MIATLLAAVLAAGPASAEDRQVVKVNGTPIRQSEVMERLWKRFGPATLEEMVDELLLRQEAVEQKVQADAAVVDKRLARIKAQFEDPGAFERQLKENDTSVEKVRAEIAEQVQLEELLKRKAGIAVKDQELKQAFDKHKEKLGAPPAVHLRHILVKTEAEAKDIVAQAKAGKDFTELAREKSLAPTGKLKGGDYGFVSKGVLPREIDEVAFAMKSNELRIISSPRGFHILQALEKRAAKPAAFSEVKDDLREMLLTEKMKAVLPGFLQELRRKAKIEPQGV